MSKKVIITKKCIIIEKTEYDRTYAPDMMKALNKIANYKERDVEIKFEVEGKTKKLLNI